MLGTVCILRLMAISLIDVAHGLRVMVIAVKGEAVYILSLLEIENRPT